MMEINFLQITYSSCAVALRYQRRLKNLRLVVLASQKLTAWSEEGARGREMGELPGSMGGGGVGWVGIHQHHRRPAKSQGLWPREVAAAPAGPHQARDYTTSSSRNKLLPFLLLRIYSPTQPFLQFDFSWRVAETFSYALRL